MYGGSGKFGRGRGRGGGPVKRNIHSTFQPSSVPRPSTTTGGGRLSAGGGHRNRNNTPAAPDTVSTTDETFSLVRNNPPNFGMIIRLSPILVDEIKRLEAQGGAARIKFDSSAKNPAGNVINVGGKEFRFTWSHEPGDDCDIYEERRTGDNGDGLLVESGGAWRRLNVQRELDDSIKNHVKMRTVEAEQKKNYRKSIILDPGNPSMKNQKKALAAAEVNNKWRGSYKQNKEPPFKKTKAEPSSAVIPPKKSKVTRVHASKEDEFLTQSNKENTEKELFIRVSQNKPTDLQSLLISLLLEKPQGMNFRALEKAIGETIPKSVKQIEPVLKKKCLPESGSSTENNNHIREATAPESSFPLKADESKDSHLISEIYEELNTSEKIEIEHSKGPEVSSSNSESDSDSESDSSDIESDASSNSKEGSDEDVDIMSDDDKELKQKLLQSDPSIAPEVGYVKDLFEDNQEPDFYVTTNSFPDKDGDETIRSIDLNAHAKHVEGLDLDSIVRYSERGSQTNKEIRDEVKNSPIDYYRTKLPVVNGRGATLRRELSDIEIGEFCVNFSGTKKHFERNNSFKQSENDYWNLDPCKTAKTSPLQQEKQSLSRVEKNKHEKQVVPLITIDSRRQKSNSLEEKKKDFWVVDSRSNRQKREMESSSDDSITSYTKYEKEEPEMKGPIKDHSQYNVYVGEYLKKYDCYSALNKILESYRNQFQMFGRDLDLAKERDNDRYNKILEQLMESYRQCGTKQKRLKKIFEVLHHELQHLKEMISDFADKHTKV